MTTYVCSLGHRILLQSEYARDSYVTNGAHIGTMFAMGIHILSATVIVLAAITCTGCAGYGLADTSPVDGSAIRPIPQDDNPPLVLDPDTGTPPGSP